MNEMTDYQLKRFEELVIENFRLKAENDELKIELEDRDDRIAELEEMVTVLKDRIINKD